MNLEKRTFAMTCSLMTAITLVVSILAPRDLSARESTETSKSQMTTIIGAWRTVVTPRNCQTGDPLGSLSGLFTFHQGGTMSEYGIGPGSSPALRSPGHGVWQRENGPHNYSFAFTFYRYDALGFFIGSQKITAALKLGKSANHFITSSAIEVLDANDNLVATGCATAAGTRFD